jgi:hypothetical protein
VLGRMALSIKFAVLRAINTYYFNGLLTPLTSYKVMWCYSAKDHRIHFIFVVLEINIKFPKKLKREHGRSLKMSLL